MRSIERFDKMRLYTDGSCSPNPGRGGYAVILDGEPVSLGSEICTTNIRMEGMAILEALRYANGERCEIVTDSQFWINVITKWAKSWEKNGYKGRKNVDLVKALYSEYNNENCTLVFTRGHAGEPGNELADSWANRARVKE